MKSLPYIHAQETYAAYNVDTERVLNTLGSVSLSLHCWQGDDVGGFENPQAGLTGGGIQATGNYPGKARTMAELRQDLEKVLSLLPGRHRLNLHACYADFSGGKVDRDQLNATHFQSWIDWAKAQGIGLDFNPTYFSHPLANDGATLSSADPKIRAFWVQHGIACRQIGAQMGQQLLSPTVTNIWIPDGSKDLPIDRQGPRERLAESLDLIFQEKLDPQFHRDALEPKLFGIGSESYVVGSHEFYLGYAVKHQKLLCLDAGHFHPTESVADKISSVLLHVPEILLHISRGVRWDSDHVVIFDDATRELMQELVRGNLLARTHIGLDYFDASINRVAAWTIGARSTLKALLYALLEPTAHLRELENRGDFSGRLALLEEAKMLPFGAVWAEYLSRHNVPDHEQWSHEIKTYEQKVLTQRV